LVAGFAHPPNVDAAKWMAGAIMKSIFEQVPDATSALVGADPSHAVRGLADTRIEVAGRVSEEELRAPGSQWFRFASGRRQIEGGWSFARGFAEAERRRARRSQIASGGRSPS
jgi:hypothetical protein